MKYKYLNNNMRCILLVSVVSVFSFQIMAKWTDSDIANVVLEELKNDGLEFCQPAKFVDITPNNISKGSDFIQANFNYLLFEEDFLPQTEDERKNYKRENITVFLRIPKDANSVYTSSHFSTLFPGGDFGVDADPFRLNIYCTEGHCFIKETRGSQPKLSLYLFFNPDEQGLIPKTMRRVGAIKEAMNKAGISHDEAEKYIAELTVKLYGYDDEALFKKIASANVEDLQRGLSVSNAIEIGTLIYLRNLGTFPGTGVGYFKAKQKVGFEYDRITIYYYLSRVSKPDNIASFQIHAFTSKGRNCWSGQLKVDADKVKSQEEIDSFIRTVLCVDDFEELAKKKGT